MAKEKNYYEILGIAKYSGIDEIKVSYKRAVKTLHPDANVGKPKAEVERKKEMFEKIQSIYDELSVPAKKAAYDKKLILESYSGVHSKYVDESWGKF